MTSLPIKLLIAEDDEDDIYLFMLAVMDSQLPLQVTVAKNVPDAIHQLSKSLPDIIVIDIILPPSNGFELLEKIRMDEKYNDIPVIMFSTSASKSYIEMSLKKGATLYIIKPDDYKRLLQVIDKIYTTSIAGDDDSPAGGFLFSYAV